MLLKKKIFVFDLGSKGPEEDRDRSDGSYRLVLAFTFSGVKCIFKEAGAGDLRFDTQSCRSSVIDVLILLNLTINVLIANYIFYFVRQL